MKPVVVLLSVIIVIIAGWVVAWFAVAGVIKLKASQFMAASANTSRQIQCEKFAVSGFPWRFDVTCANLVISASDISFSLPEITATVLIYRPTGLTVSAFGPAQITDAFSGSARLVRWDNLRLSVRTNGWALKSFFVNADNFELVDNIAGEKLVARVASFSASLVDNPDKYNKAASLAQLSALVRAGKVSLPEFDLTNANLRLAATIDAIADDIRQWSLATIASNWFAGKTGIDLSAFSGADARSEFDLSGRLSANGQARLSGDFALYTKNVAERLVRFIDPTTLQILFGFPNRDNSRFQSYSLRHGVLLAGNLPVLTFSALN